MTRILFYTCLAIIVMEVILSVMVILSHRDGSKKALIQHRRSTLMFFFQTTMLLIAMTVRYSRPRVEVMNEYYIGATYIYIIMMMLYNDSLFGYRWYVVPYIWMEYLCPFILLTASRLYFDTYFDYNNVYQSWSEIAAYFTMTNTPLLFRFVFLVYLIGAISVITWELFNYHKAAQMLNEQDVNYPSWYNRYFYASVVTMFTAFLGSLISTPVYHFLTLVVIVAVSIYGLRDFKADNNNNVSTEPVKQFRDQQNYAQMELMSENIEQWLKSESFPLCQDMNLVKMARHMQVKPSNLDFYFEFVKKTTFQNWMAKKRLEYCSRMLRITDLPLGDISTKAGYHDLSAMSKAFKRTYGITPTQYRKGEKTIVG